jgi:hypothetical protein
LPQIWLNVYMPGDILALTMNPAAPAICPRVHRVTATNFFLGIEFLDGTATVSAAEILANQSGEIFWTDRAADSPAASRSCVRANRRT